MGGPEHVHAAADVMPDAGAAGLARAHALTDVVWLGARPRSCSDQPGYSMVADVLDAACERVAGRGVPDLPPHRGPGRRSRSSRLRAGWEADPLPEAVGRLRHEVRAQLARWGVVGAAAAAAEVVVGELITNAVEHAGTPFRLAVSFDGSGVRVLVRDLSREPPRLQQVDHLAKRGRGLQLIDRLCARWDWMLHPDGKTVWALLRTDRAG